MTVHKASPVTLFRLLISLPLAGLLVGCFWPGPQLWGLNHLAYLPLPPMVAAMWPVFILLMIWTPLAGHLGTWLVRRVEPLLLGHRLFVYLVLPLLGMGLAWLGRAHTPLLGDGMLVSAMISQGTLFHGFDWTAYHGHASLAVGLGLSDLLSVFKLLAISSILTGGAYLIAVSWAARRLHRQPGDAVLLCGLLIPAAPLLMFFGYAECYAQMTVCLLVCGAYLLLYLEGRAPLNRGTIWFGFALLWHLNALLMAPLILAVALWSTPARQSLARRCWAVVWPSMVAVLMALGLQFIAGQNVTDFVDDFLGSHQGWHIFNRITGPRGLADPRLGKDLLNLLLLLVPVSLALMLTVRSGRLPKPTRPLMIAPLWILLLAMVLHLKLGVVRDWDLLAGSSILVSLVAFASWQQCPARDALSVPFTGFILVAGLGLTVPWIAVNAMEEATLHRFPSVTSDLPSYPRALAWEDLGRWHREHDDLDRTLQAYRQACRACPLHPRYHLLCGQLEHRRGQNVLAIPSLRRALELDPDLLMARKTLLQCLMDCERYQEALSQARLLAGTEVDDASVAATHGMLAESADHPEEAVKAYVRAIQFDGSRLDLMARVGALELASGRLDRAEYAFRKVLDQDQGSALARLGLAQTLWELSQVDSGDQRQRYREILALLEGLDNQHADPSVLDAWRADLHALLEP